MKRLDPARLTITLLAAAALSACSDRHAVAPDGAPSTARGAADVPGSYEISFMREAPGGLQPVAADGHVPVGTYVVLKSEVRNAAGVRATSGTVTYEFCSLGGEPAPRAACEGGGGSWRRHLSVRVDPIGSLVGWGACSTPRAIGFRFRYSGKGNGIASGTSPSKDVTWDAVAPAP